MTHILYCIFLGMGATPDAISDRKLNIVAAIQHHLDVVAAVQHHLDIVASVQHHLDVVASVE